MLRAAPVLRRLLSTTPRPAPQNAEFAELAGRLQSKGIKWQTHVMSKNSTDNVSACPFLQTNDILMRQAQRESSARTYSRRIPFAIARAEGCTLTDTNGNKYIDALANAGTLSLGHNHPVVVKAIRDFLDSSQPMQQLDLSTPYKDAFVTQLFSALPAKFAENARVQFCGPTGTDVVETALKLAQINTKRHTVISFHGAYHGHSNGSLSLMGNVAPKTNVINLAAGVQVAPYPYAYRCPFGIGEKGHERMSYYLENMLNDVESGVKKPGCLIVECIQGEGGVVTAPVEWLREIRRITAAHGILMIVDEVQTGFFRTGKTFCHEHADIVPDIICMSKALGGSLPMACIVFHKSLDIWGPGAHAGTFRGNNMAFATGTAALKWSLENNLASEAARKGEKLRGHILRAQKAFPDIIGDVRGRGLMIGAEIVNPKGKRDHLGSLPIAPDIAFAISSGCLTRGVICERGGRNSTVVRFLPPLIITDAEVDKIGETFYASVEAAAKVALA